jgi:hypothetical protein
MSQIQKPKTTKPGTVRKIVKSPVPGQSEKAEIEVHDAGARYREIRIENSLENSRGKKVKRKPGAHVEVTVEANERHRPKTR